VTQPGAIGGPFGDENDVDRENAVTSSSQLSTPYIPVSWGELLDKITILEIKRQHIVSESAQVNIRAELSLLEEVAAPMLMSQKEIGRLQSELKSVNEALWTIEEKIRGKEHAQMFDAEFVALARSVYKRNDERAALKKKINDISGSHLVEEKSYG
jgi:Family of unknown function (DUF6165)